ncbi:unnamed protein product [Microthlaspi erraticum]|uniref:Aspartic peptidase DDI1-type domain-containing protein n=2 Tax=Microthlaspi erraticum TaxID=1685480 RepID=A0A6D2KKX1_9BRAS|nr:unnamed protein product [Microthlaspi erraticum]
MKAILTNNVSLEEGAMMITKECSAILQNRMPEKLNDPGSFVLSCKIGSTHFHRALCDLGSSVNLMPYSVAKLLGITDFKPTKISLVFADRSVRRPVGVIMDVPIMVGDCYIPADFVVLDLEHQPKDPLILGRPFLATAGAIIDVKNGKIDLHLGDIVMNFEVNKSMEKPIVDVLTKAENEFGYMEREAQGLVKFMDSMEAYKELVAYMDLEREEAEPLTDESKAIPETKVKFDPWCPLRAPKAELKQLPVRLRYEYLGPNKTYPVIVNAALTKEETALERHRRSEKRHKTLRRLGALATFSAHACEGSRSSGITQKLDERLHPGTTVHRGTRFILPSIGLTGAPCQCLVGSHIVIWYHTRPRQLTRLSSESSSLHAQPPRCQSGWALTCENALDYTFLDNMWLDTPHVLST